MFDVDCHAVSDIGAGHHVSQDQFVIADVLPSKRNSRHSDQLVHDPAKESQADVSRMFGVAHGIQGLPAGDRASQIVMETAREFVTRNLHNRVEWRPEALFCTLTAVPGKCAEALSDDVAKNPWEKGLGSTLTLACVAWPQLYLIHVGDCRCYLRRDCQIERLTSDQVVDGTLAERGVVSRDSHQPIRRRTLWSFIGDSAQNLNPQITEIELRVGDTLMLCTTGFAQEVPDDRISELLDSDDPAKDLCSRLLATARDSGGTDDMTVIVVRFRDRQANSQSAAQHRTDSAPFHPLMTHEKSAAPWHVAQEAPRPSPIARPHSLAAMKRQAV